MAQFEITPEDLSHMVPAEWKRGINLGDKPAWTILNFMQLLFSAKVNETVTGIVLSSNTTVACNPLKYVLEFLDITPESYRRGLTYTGFVSVE